MSHPWHHAISSAKQFGGQADDYVELHSWFDQSKRHHADFRHRALRHHDLGIALARRLFGDEMVNSDGVMVLVQTIGEQHLQEDLARQATASDWFSLLEPVEWMRRTPIPSALQAERSAAKWGGEPEEYLALHRFFDQSASSGLSPSQHRGLHHHSEGIFLAEQLFGVTLTLSSGRKLPTRWIGEQHMQEELGQIPPVSDWLRAISPAGWMSPRASKALREISAG